MEVQVEGGRVHFPEWYDERGEWEAESKGWLQGVEFVSADGHRYPLFFYDPVRLTQDLEGVPGYRPVVLAEPGMVVVPGVTRDAILRAIPELVARRFFECLRPLTSVAANGVASAAGSGAN
jgi:hypothetical protein